MRLVFLLISTVLLLLVLSLMISSLSVHSWSKINDKSVMSLIGCIDCKPLNNDWNFECFARSICNENSDLGLCKIYTTLYKASFAFYILEIASMIMGILLMEKIAILAMNGDFGSPLSVYFIGSMMLAFHLLAICLWLGITGASWSDCFKTTDIFATQSVCVLDGPKVAIANIFFITLFLAYFFFIFAKRNVQYLHKVVTLKKLLWINGRFWCFVAMGLLGITNFVILASLVTSSWVTKGQIEGSLTRCLDCTEVDWMGWECLAGTECSINSSSENCDFYSKLSRSSKGFIVLEAMTIICLMFFSQSLTSLVRGRIYGLRFLNYAYPLLAVFFNTLATSVWFGTTQSKFNNCDLCAESGPGLAVASQFFIIPMAVIFCLVYFLRSENMEGNKIDTSIGDKVIDLTKDDIIFSESPKKTHGQEEEKEEKEE